MEVTTTKERWWWDRGHKSNDVMWWKSSKEGVTVNEGVGGEGVVGKA